MSKKVKIKVFLNISGHFVNMYKICNIVNFVSIHHFLFLFNNPPFPIDKSSPFLTLFAHCVTLIGSLTIDFRVIDMEFMLYTGTLMICC